jgi:uncharacterized lipoprotein YmbA
MNRNAVVAKENAMASEWKTDFGQLYRRVFAEQDPVAKRSLLQQVQAALDAWKQANNAIALKVNRLSDDALPAGSLPAAGIALPTASARQRL